MLTYAAVCCRMARAGACDAADDNDCNCHVNYRQVFGYAHTRPNTNTHTPKHTHTRPNTHTHTPKHTHTHAQTPTHTRPNTHTHTPKHPHTHAQTPSHTQNRHFNHWQSLRVCIPSTSFLFSFSPFFLSRVWYAPRSVAVHFVCTKRRKRRVLQDLFFPHSPCDFRWGWS